MMDGLFNYRPDPIAQSLLGFAGGALTPVSRGGGLGAGLLGASQGMAQARQEAMQIEQLKRQMAQDEMRKRLIEAQIKETENQAAERQLKVEQDKRKREAIARVQAALTGQDAQIPQGFDMRSANPQQSNFQQSRLNSPAMVMSLLNAGFGPDQIKLLAESGNLGRAKVAGTVETTDAQGRPVTKMRDEFGGFVGDAMPKAYQRERVSQGDRISFVDPYTNDVNGGLQMFQSPDSKASNALGWANNSIAKQRLAMDMSDPKLQYDSDRGGLVNQRTGEFVPAMQDGKPIGPKEKPLTESQGKASLFGTRAAEADKVLTELEGKYSRPSVAIKAGLENLPLVGGGVSSGYNLVMGKNEQLAEQAQRNFINAVLRQESGAVISAQEFENARKQYFPQPGDSAAVVSQKRQNRIDAINGFKTMAGPAGKFEAARPSGATGGWSIEKQ